MSRIVLWVSDMDAQIAFYSRLLNLTVINREPGFAELTSEANTILLHELPVEYRSRVPLTEIPKPQDEVAIKPVFGVDDLKAVKAFVKGTLALVSKEGVYGSSNYLDMVDPEGNVFQLEQIS